jgi:hypothetical protein
MRKSTIIRIPHPASLPSSKIYRNPKTFCPQSVYRPQPKTNRLCASDSTQTAVWDDLVGRPQGSRSGTNRAHRRTFYLSNGANRANRRHNRAGRAAAPYRREGPKSYGCLFFFFLMIYGWRRENLGFVHEVLQSTLYSTFA